MSIKGGGKRKTVVCFLDARPLTTEKKKKFGSN